jgi:hypothetical protein
MSTVSSTVFRNSVDVTGAKTLTVADCGIVQNVTATATITLPATDASAVFHIRNGGDKKVTVTVSPNAADKIFGNGFTATDNKDIINTLGSGWDEVVLVGDGVDGWFISEMNGTWTQEA